MLNHDLLVVESFRHLDARLFFTFQIVIILYIYAYTKAYSKIRIFTLPLILFNAFICVSGSTLAFPTAGRLTFFMTWSIWITLCYIENSLRSRWDFDHGGPTKATCYSAIPENGATNGRTKPNQSGTVVQRLRFALWTLTSFRDPNSPWHVKGIPGPTPTKTRLHPKTRSQFLKQNAIIFAITYFYIDIVENTPIPDDLTPFRSDKIRFFSRLHEITFQELLTRIFIPVSIWLTTYCCLLCPIALEGFILVILGLNDVEDWPYYFGSIKDAYTIRGFWGSYWHPSLRKPLTGTAHTITHTIIRLPQHSLIARYLKLFFVFLQSGIFHLLLEMAVDMPHFKSGAVRFFCMQAFGIMFEDFVQFLWRNFCGKRKVEDKKNISEGKEGRWKKIVGFIWVTFFLLIWTSPSWQFPRIEHHGEEGAGADRRMLPFTLVGGFLNGR